MRGATKTGIIRHIDDLGRIVIPIEIRRRFGLAEKDPVQISVSGDRILLTKPHATCVFCGADDALEDYYRSRAVCRRCIDELAAVGLRERAAVEAVPRDAG